MRREFLEQLGLAPSDIEAVMTEHGKSTQSYRLRCEEAEGALAAKCEEMDGLYHEVNTLRAEKEAFLSFREGVIEEMIAEAQPRSPLVTAEVRRRLDAAPDGKLRACLSSLREEFPEAFAAGKACPIFCLPTTVPPTEEGMVMKIFRRR